MLVQDSFDLVKYKSAHIEGVESEKIVRSSHSVQGNPETILELRRIEAAIRRWVFLVLSARGW